MRSVTGLWHNEQGAEVTLESGADGSLRGHFRPGSGFGSREQFAVSGFTSGSLIAFVVDFGKYGSLTSWVGHIIDDGGAALRTLWQMTLEQPHPGQREERWKTIWTGANTFRPGHGPAEGRQTHGGATPPLWPS